MENVLTVIAATMSFPLALGAARFALSILLRAMFS